MSSPFDDGGEKKPDEMTRAAGQPSYVWSPDDVRASHRERAERKRPRQSMFTDNNNNPPASNMRAGQQQQSAGGPSSSSPFAGFAGPSSDAPRLTSAIRGGADPSVFVTRDLLDVHREERAKMRAAREQGDHVARGVGHYDPVQEFEEEAAFFDMHQTETPWPASTRRQEETAGPSAGRGADTAGPSAATKGPLTDPGDPDPSGARLPDLNWGPHDMYLADGTLNPNPPHGDCTYPTTLGRSSPPATTATETTEATEASSELTEEQEEQARRDEVEDICTLFGVQEDAWRNGTYVSEFDQVFDEVMAARDPERDRPLAEREAEMRLPFEERGNAERENETTGQAAEDEEWLGWINWDACS
jgi:hypothetical protein